MDPFRAKCVAAATGSTMTALTMTPFDVVKTRLQTQPPVVKHLFPRPPSNACCQPPSVACVRKMSSLARPMSTEVVCLWEQGVFRTERVNGFLDAVRRVWRAEGLRGLWKGAGTSLLIGVPSSTSYILTYDHLLNVVLPPLIPSQPLIPLVSGVLARTFITSVMSPLELIRTNLQAAPLSPENPRTLRSVLTSVRSLVQSQGFSCLWRGLGPTLWRDVPFSGIYWAGYESWKAEFQRHGYQGPIVAFYSGAISGVTAALVTSPFDVLKTRQQALLLTMTRTKTVATIPLISSIVRTEGMSALFAGLFPRMAKIAPACGIMIACFEGVGTYLTKRS